DGTEKVGKVGEDHALLPPEVFMAFVYHLDRADRVLFKGNASDMHLDGPERESREIGRKPGRWIVTAGDKVLCSQVLMVGSQIDVVEFSGAPGLPFDCQRDLPAGWDPVPLACSVHGPEGALLGPVR